MKHKIKIVDRMFDHAKYSTDYQDSKYIEWDRTHIKNDDKYIFYTDHSLSQVSENDSTKFAWLLETPDIINHTYKWITTNNNRFTYVLTYDKNLLDKGENYIFYGIGGCWIKPEDQKIYKKTKLTSTIVSQKRMTHGHMLRHHSIAAFGGKMSVFGRGYNPVEYKLETLKDYAFSLTIENQKMDYYFSEKLIDCFVTGTVPIYWGCPSISKFFNTDGMIIFDNINELNKIFKETTLEQYIKMKDAIEENFERAKDYLISEDYIYKNYLDK